MIECNLIHNQEKLRHLPPFFYFTHFYPPLIFMQRKVYFLFRMFVVLVGLMVSVAAWSQDRKLTGRVTASDGQALPGVTVLLKGTSNGTNSDAEGKFTINVTGATPTVVFSSIGFITREIVVGNRTSLDVSMAENASILNEVVVTGYGSQSKREITGAVTTVSAKDLQAVPATTFAQQLQGRASGLNVVNDATPGGNATVRIRGFGTIGNNDPLYVIDGVPTENSGNLNPNDIETIQILKDASSASIYGSRAANGVVIITTKKGKAGKPTISVNIYRGSQTAAKDVEALNAKEIGRAHV